MFRGNFRSVNVILKDRRGGHIREIEAFKLILYQVAVVKDLRKLIL